MSGLWSGADISLIPTPRPPLKCLDCCRYFSGYRSGGGYNKEFIQGCLSAFFKDNTQLVCQGRRPAEFMQSLKTI